MDGLLDLLIELEELGVKDISRTGRLIALRFFAGHPPKIPPRLYLALLSRKTAVLPLLTRFQPQPGDLTDFV